MPFLADLRDLLSTPAALGLLREYLEVQRRLAAAAERANELQEIALGVDPASVQAAYARAQPPPEGAVVVDAYDPALAEEFTEIARDLKASLGQMPTDEQVIDEYERRLALEEEAAAHAQRTTLRGSPV